MRDGIEEEQGLFDLSPDSSSIRTISASRSGIFGSLCFRAAVSFISLLAE